MAALNYHYKNLGYHGNLGYQTILYPNEVDLRKLFMFLIEKMPKDSPALTKESQDRPTLLQNEAKRKIRDALQRSWLPSHCIEVARKYRYSDKSAAPLTEYGIKHCHSFRSAPGFHTKECFTAPNIYLTKELFPTLLNIHAEELGKEMAENSEYFDKYNIGVTSNLSEESLQRLLPEDQPLIKSAFEEVIESTNISESKDIEGIEKVTKLQDLLNETKEKLEEVSSQLTEKEKSVTNLNKLLKEQITNLKNEENLMTKLHKTSLLLSDSETNVQKLKNSLQSSKERDKKLLKQWEEFSEPLIEEKEELEAQLCDKKDEKTLILELISDLKTKIRSLSSQLAKKEALVLQLTQQRDSLPKGVKRSVYIKQILDISSKVRKQKSEIDKVLSETRIIQKEINNLTGKLDRTFAVIEDASYKAASNNERARPIYRAVISIHEECGKLVDIIRETGTIEREIADLREQVNAEKSKTVEENLKNLQEDLNRIKLENSVLKKRLNSQDSV